MPKAAKRDLICRTVVEMLRAERKRKGLSMERLAEKAGLSTSMVSLYERDLRNPTLETLLRVSEVLEIDLGRLIQKAVQKSSRVQEN